MGEQNFNFGDFFDEFGNTVQDVVTGFGDTTTANAANSQAIANMNNATAAATLTKAQSNAQLQKHIGIALIALVVLVGLAFLLKPVLSKIKL